MRRDSVLQRQAPVDPAVGRSGRGHGHAARGIELVSYAVYPSPKLRAGDFGMLLLRWRAPQSVNARLAISLRVVDNHARIVYQRDGEPANGARPTLGWAPEEIVEDAWGFFIPLDAAAGVYRLMLVVYEPARGTELVTQEGAMTRVAEVQVVTH